MVVREPIVNSLQASVHGRLAEIARTAGAEPAARQVPVLAGALHAVLAEHPVGPSGHCVTCHGRRSRLSRRRRGNLPCRAYLAVQLALDAAPVVSE